MAEPKTMTFEEMQALLAKGSKKATGKKSTKSRSPKVPKVSSAPMVPDDEVYIVRHFYLRKGDAWQILLNDAKAERENTNKNIVVFAHNHPFNLECVTTCREIV